MSFVQLLQSLRQLFIHLNLMYEFKLQNHNICTNNNKNNNNTGHESSGVELTVAFCYNIYEQHQPWQSLCTLKHYN